MIHSAEAIESAEEIQLFMNCDITLDQFTCICDAVQKAIDKCKILTER